MTWKHISDCLPDIKNLNKTNNLDRMDEMTYPTLSEVYQAIHKRDADLLAALKRIDRLDERVRQLEGHGKQFEKIGQ